jgi:hypothetical protein
MADHLPAKREAQRQAAPARAATPVVQPLLALQRSAGNAALGQYLSRSRARHVARSATAACGCPACASGPAVHED